MKPITIRSFIRFFIASIVFSFPQYDLKALDNDGQLVNLSLEELLKVTVTTASKTEYPLANAPASVTVISNRQIKAYGWRNLADVLQAQTGFYVFSDHIYDFVIPRGHYQSNDPNSRFLLLLNGHSVIEGFGYFNGHLPSVDINHIERIEIVRGPGSSIYGTNAMFAVVNVITRKPTTTEQTQFNLDIGNDGTRKASIRGDWLLSGGEISILASKFYSDEESFFFDEYVGSVHPQQGISEASANRQTGSNFLFEASLDEWMVSAYHNRRTKNVPTGVFGGAINGKHTFFEDTNQFFELKRLISLSDKTQLTLRAFYDAYEFKGRFYYLPDSNGVTGPSYESEFNRVTDSSTGFESLINTNWSDSYQTVAGIEYKAYGDVDFIYVSENDPLILLNERFNYNPDETITSLFISQHYHFNERLDATLGLHYDYYESVGGHSSIRGSLNYQFSPRTQLKLLYGEAFRAPNSWELNGGFFLTGNSELSPETSRSWELVFDYSINDQWFWHTSLFNYQTDNNIQKSPDGVAFINTTGDTGDGVDTEFRYSLGANTGYLTYSLANVENRDDRQPLSFSPKTQIKLGFVHQFENNLSLALESQWIDQRLLADQNQGSLPAYNVTNLSLSHFSINDTIEFSFNIHNVFDTQYQYPALLSDLATFYINASHPVYDIPADGRRYQANIQAVW